MVVDVRHHPIFSKATKHRIFRPRPKDDIPKGAREGFFWRRATCKEVDCPDYLNGWRTACVVGSKRDLYISKVMNPPREYQQVILEGGLKVEYYFKPGQTCFAAYKHLVTLHNPLHGINGQRVEPPRWLYTLQEAHHKLGEARKKGG